MKNIHVLPTNKPSRLYFWENKLRIGDLTTAPKNLGITNQNIYIISDEEIKEVDWVIECSLNWVFKMHKHGLPNYNPNKKKIILTTDQDLIKDGVQAIDDEFLEWFVKNPSCERVKVNKEWNEERIIDGKDIGDYSYKIIIPKEEFTIIKGGDDIVFPSSTIITFKPLPDVNWESDITNKVWDEDEPKQIKCYCGHTITCDCEPLQETTGKEFYESADKVITVKKQETLEEAATKLLYEKYPYHPPQDSEYWKDMFLEGANWQKERMYSEEQVIILLQKYRYDLSSGKTANIGDTTKFWFEQFKKKFD
jgi:hypothetical protein